MAIGAGRAGLVGCRSASTPDLPLHVSLAEKVKALRGLSSKTLTVLYPKGCLGNLSPVASMFRELTQIKLELIEASLDEISAEMVLSNTIGTSNYDVAIPATFGIPDLVESGTIAPLDDFAARYELPEMQKSALYTLGDRYKSQLFGYQADGDTYLMFYNRDWLTNPEQKARYEDRFSAPLAVPKTWAELDQQMAFFHAPDDDRYGGSLYRNLNYIAWEFWVRLHAQGLYPVADDMTPRVNTPASLEALQQLIAASDSLAPDVWENGLFENFASFGDGKKYCNIGWGGTQKYLHSEASSLRDRLTFGPVPGGTFDGKVLSMPYFNWGWNYVVSARSKVPELAYLFILFASTPFVSTRSVQEASGYFDPFREEHYADPVIQETYGAEFLKVHRQSLKACIPDFYLRGQGRYLHALKQAIHTASLGQIDPKLALDTLADRWNTITDELGRESQQEQWRYLKASYPATLQAVLR